MPYPPQRTEPYKVLRYVDNSLIVSERFLKKIKDGYGFSVSHRFEGVASGSAVEMYFENPSGSGRTVYIVTISVISFGQAWADVYRGNTVSVAGTALTPVNLNFGSSITSVVNVEYGGTYTTGTLVHNTVVPGGSLVRAVGGAVEIGETVVIPPGYNLLARVTNQSASSSDISIRIIW